MYKAIKIIAIGIFIFAVIAMRITNHFGFEKWQVSLGLLGFAILLFLLSYVLTHYFIHKRAPDFASTKEVFPCIQEWELTAGTGIVPKWVSLIGFFSFSALITAILPWVIMMLKAILK